MSNRRFAVIGDPIAHSLSPLLHQSAFDELEELDAFSDLADTTAEKISAQYVAYHLKKEDLASFMDMFRGRKSLLAFRPLSLLKEGDSYAKGLWPCEPPILEKNSTTYQNPILSENIPTPPNSSAPKSPSLQSPTPSENLSALNFSSHKSPPLPENLRMGGLSVTLPHKKEIMSYADELTPLASLVGAANTLYWDNGKLIAHNTDVEGFLSPLYKYCEILRGALPPTPPSKGAEPLCNPRSGRDFRQALLRLCFMNKVENTRDKLENIQDKVFFKEGGSVRGENSFFSKKCGFPSHENSSKKCGFPSHENSSKKCGFPSHEKSLKTAMILGAGGAAAAVLVGLLHVRGVEKIYVCARNGEQAEGLLEYVRGRACEGCLDEALSGAIFSVPEVLSYAERERAVDLVVNTIPATLNGEAFSPRESFEGVGVAYDLLYAHTPFLECARGQGSVIINGAEMFLQQGSRQFKLWTGKEIPPSVLLAVKNRIEGSK